MTATAACPLALGDKLVSRDGLEATVIKMELRGGLGGSPRETWARLACDGDGRRWVQVQPPEAAVVDGSNPDALPAGDESDYT